MDIHFLVHVCSGLLAFALLLRTSFLDIRIAMVRRVRRREVVCLYWNGMMPMSLKLLGIDW
jgi:ABC-type uncharacterized transport system permease subunit